MRYNCASKGILEKWAAVALPVELDQLDGH